MRTLNISEEGFKKFLAIKAARPQDTSRAATFDHILKMFEEQQPKPAIKIYGEAMTLKAIRTPIIDAEKAQKDFIQLGGQKS